LLAAQRIDPAARAATIGETTAAADQLARVGRVLVIVALMLVVVFVVFVAVLDLVVIVVVAIVVVVVVKVIIAVVDVVAIIYLIQPHYQRRKKVPSVSDKLFANVKLNGFAIFLIFLQQN